MAVSRPLLTLPVTASAAITAKYFVTGAGAVCGDGAKAIGVSQFNCDDTKTISVIALGTAVVIAGAGITADDDVASDAAGKAVTAAAGDVILGRALETAAAAADEIEVLLTNAGAIVPAA